MPQQWAFSRGSSLETRFRYTPTDCFETFPFPSQAINSSEVLEAVGNRFDGHRREMMLASQEGLTKIYNRFHDRAESSASIKTLRALHVEIDEAVKRAYCWDDFTLGHGFRETEQGLRYTISEDARVEVLDRLLELNHARYAEEVKAGLHAPDSKGKAKPAAATKVKPAKKEKRANARQAGLFGGHEE
jgi:hypothetical protein